MKARGSGRKPWWGLKPVKQQRSPEQLGQEAQVRLTAAGHCGSQKQKVAKAMFGWPNLHETDVTPSLGITDQFPTAAAVALARERQFLPYWQGQGRAGGWTGARRGVLPQFPQPGGRSGAASAGANGWRGLGHADRTLFPAPAQLQAQVTAEDSSS